MTPENYEHYNRALPYLSEYRQKHLLKLMDARGERYLGIEVYSPKEAIQDNIQHIKALLSGMGFSVDGNSNTETIYIK